MRTFGKILLGLVVVVLVAVIGGYWWFTHTYPKIDPPADMAVEATPARLERGKYLVEHVVGCLDCHSTRDWQYYSGPTKPGTEGQGGDYFDQALVGVPGVLYAANITPSGIGSQTDGEIYRTITTGVKKNGDAMFPLMPYLHFGRMADEDIQSIIAFIRTLKPIANEVPSSHLDFPLNLIVRTMPAPADPQPIPDTSDEVAYGGYLVNAAGCTDCHTPMTEKGERIAGMEFAGGYEFHFPTGIICRSANITPDSSTGIGKWDRAQFLARFKKFDTDEARQTKVDPTDFNTIMPWTLLAGMTESDLGAIYAYLRTLKPVNHQVEHFAREAATQP